MLKPNASPPETEDSWSDSAQGLSPGESLRFRSTRAKKDVEQIQRLGLVCTGIPGLFDWPRRIMRRFIWQEATKPLDLAQCVLSKEEEALVHALEVHGRIVFRARGGSMRPFIADESLVEVSQFSNRDEPTPGQILLVAQPGRTVLHRLVEVVDTSRGRAYVFRGDRVAQFDRPVWRDAILGFYTGHKK